MSDGFLSDTWDETGDDSGDDFDLADPETYEEKEAYYRVVGAADICALEERAAAEVGEMLSLDTGTSRILLKAYGWNRKQLFDEFLEGRALKTVGLSDLSIALQRTAGSLRKRHTNISCCPICCEEYTNGFELACGHQVCVDCYRRYVADKIEAGDVHSIRCLGSTDCPLLVKAADCEVLSQDVYAKYRSKVAALFVQNQTTSLKSCTNSKCDQVIELTTSLAMLDTCQLMVQCSCRQEFCLKCKNSWHTPVTCEIATKWLEISSEAIKNHLWIENNTKQCPKCEARTERTEGCNHMKCSNCHFEYCWMCMQDWSKHVGMFFNCVHFRASADEKNSGKAVTAKFKHYAIRYDSNHADSLRDTKARDLTFSSKQVELMAASRLSRTRRVLGWTYVLLFYTVASNQKTLLETNVSDLEASAETLAESLFGDEGPTSRCVELADYLESRTEKLTTHALDTAWKYDRHALSFVPK